ncbi:MAG: error-prone DNA polymerase, partial [Polaromonas sp.]|nr:error-prone DNA polymerase [Polaromonas sp.]
GLVAAGQVLMHVRSRKPLHDVMRAIGLGKTVHDCGFALQANAEAHLRPRMRLADIYPARLLQATLEVAARCRFSLDEIRQLYSYPLQESLPVAESPGASLRRLTAEGATTRFPGGVPEKIAAQLAHELALIEELHYEMYFITVHDIVRFAQSQNILCQGRGSAANSAVCYCLGITAVNPAESSVLFERFMSRERREPPDIDVDFEHQRREEVIQYIYAKYGVEHAAIAATVTTYRPRSALRDVGKALAVAPALIEQLAKEHFWFDGSHALKEKLEEAGVQAEAGPMLQWLDLTVQLMGFPRHLGQHVGGFVLTQGKLTRLVPIQPATMEHRRIIQWDKDDLDAMGLLKVDVLALGMLSAIRRCLQLVDATRGGRLQMHQIESGDAQTYDMICQADTVGVFQIESRAQMAMLPRLKPRCYYDLVVQVAIVRPGPIQGGMVQPYLRRRAHPEEEAYPKEELREALGRTLGVPIFQEQVMQIAMIAAQFSADEADDLRRSMAAWKRKGGVDRFHDRLVNAMLARGYEAEFSENIFKQMQGFGEYGFPESHAASFAKLVYVSCWLKCHEPACFLAAMLNSQPMGFYAPSQLVQDAIRHGVQVRAVDVTCSGWDCALEPAGDVSLRPGYPGIRPAQPACGWACAWYLACLKPARTGCWPPEASPRSPAPKTWPCARNSARWRSTPWPQPMRWRRWRATGASRSGRPPPSSLRRNCLNRCPRRRLLLRCQRRPKGKTSCLTTAPPASRCAATRWPCCGRAWPRKGCSAPANSMRCQAANWWRPAAWSPCASSRKRPRARSLSAWKTRPARST